MPDVTRIPTELWTVIITLACVDGGFTGRSLALASRFFHSQSLSSRFHSLAFSSLRQLEGFLDLQTQMCKPKIVHLYLSFDFNPITTNSAVRLGHRFCAASAVLLTLAAPTLRTLCIVKENMAYLPLTLPCELPQLEEMSWSGHIHAFDPDTLALAGTSLCPAKLPSLKRIHFICLQGDKVVNALPAIGSALTHLRISDIDFTQYQLPGALARAVGVSAAWLESTGAPAVEGGDRRAPFSQGTLPHLRRVVVCGMQPSPGASVVPCRELWNELTARLRLLAQVCEEHGNGASLLALNEPWGQRESWSSRLKADWVDRMQGGTGCWVESADHNAVVENLERHDGAARSADLLEELT